MGPVQSSILRTLRRGTVTQDELLTALYGGSGDRAPADEANSLRVALHAMRKAGVEVERVVCYRLRSARA